MGLSSWHTRKAACLPSLCKNMDHAYVCTCLHIYRLPACFYSPPSQYPPQNPFWMPQSLHVLSSLLSCTKILSAELLSAEIPCVFSWLLRLHPRPGAEMAPRCLDGAGEEWCRKITSRLKPYCTNRGIDFLLLFLCSTNDWPVDTSCTLVLSRALLLTIMFFSLEKLHYCRSRGKTSLDTRVAFKNESRCRWFQLAFPTSDSYFITNPDPANTARVDAKFCHFSQRNRKCAFTNGQILSTKLGVTTGFDNPALFWQILRLALCVFLQALGGNVPEEFSCCWVSRFSFRPHEVEEGGVLWLNLSKGGLFSRKSTFKTELQFSWNASSPCLVPWNERPATAKAAWKPCLGCPYVLVNLFWKYKSMQY